MEVFPLISILSGISKKIIHDSPSVVVLSSIASQLISSQHYAYNLVKSSQESLVRALAVKYGDISHARFNAISPGIVDIPGRTSSFNKKIHLPSFYANHLSPDLQRFMSLK